MKELDVCKDAGEPEELEEGQDSMVVEEVEEGQKQCDTSNGLPLPCLSPSLEWSCNVRSTGQRLV